MVGHPTLVRGLSLPQIASKPASPTVVSVVAQDFIPWFLTRLEDSAGQSELGARDAFQRNLENTIPRFFQPIHRSFNIVAIEVACDVEGQPRLDPKKIIESGVTIRRRVARTEVDNNALQPDIYKDYGAGLYGWMREDDRVLGWRPVSPHTSAGTAPDPDPAARRTKTHGKNATVLKQATLLDADNANFVEDFAPLFPVSDEICEKTGKTILFGYLPVTSPERSETDAAPAAPFDRKIITDRLPRIFWGTTRRNSDTGADPLRHSWIAPGDAADPSAALEVVLAGLRYLNQEAGVFLEEDGSAALRALLSDRNINPRGPGAPMPLYKYLKDSTAALIDRNPELSADASEAYIADDNDLDDNGDPIFKVAMPVAWPAFTDEEESDLIEAMLAAVTARWTELSPGETRYQNTDATYELQAFVRVDRSDCGCPPETVWTAPSDLIKLVPWYEGGEAPPTVIELPDPKSLKGKIKPNVAFKVPAEIQQFMSNLKLDKLMDGKQPDKKIEWGMICGFSIPIITICAFIVLQIFLSLFQILFWWLAFIRICIPFPKKG